jgi:hypothetical protein
LCGPFRRSALYGTKRATGRDVNPLKTKEGKQFFLEKKNQETFANGTRDLISVREDDKTPGSIRRFDYSRFGCEMPSGVCRGGRIVRRHPCGGTQLSIMQRISPFSELAFL